MGNASSDEPPKARGAPLPSPHGAAQTRLDVNAPPGSAESPYAPPRSLPAPRRSRVWQAAALLLVAAALVTTSALRPQAAGLSMAAALCGAVVVFGVSLLRSGGRWRGSRQRVFWVALGTALVAGGILTFALTGLQRS